VELMSTFSERSLNFKYERFEIWSVCIVESIMAACSVYRPGNRDERSHWCFRRTASFILV
jgi:hypothetical protein